MPSKKPPELRNILVPMRYNIVKIIDRLKRHYSGLPDKKIREVQFTVVHPSISHGLNTTVFPLSMDSKYLFRVLFF